MSAARGQRMDNPFADVLPEEMVRQYVEMRNAGTLPEIPDPEPPSCAVCEDRGWVTTTTWPSRAIECTACDLTARRRVAKLAKLGPVQGDYAGFTFEGFPAQTVATDTVRGLLTTLATKPSCSVLLYGPIGSGKTSLGTCLFNAWVGQDTPGMWFKVPGHRGVLQQIRSTYDRDTRTSTTQLIEAISTVPILLLDDLGAERVTDWVAETLYDVIDCREADHKPLILTSNFGLDALAGRFEEPMGERIASRIQGMCEPRIYKVDGPDLRERRNREVAS